MDDFEEAVELGYLEKFLRQDHDMAETSQTIGEDELDKLMREMTNADLDSLVDDLSTNDISAADLSGLRASTSSRTAAESSLGASVGASAAGVDSASPSAAARDTERSTPTKDAPAAAAGAPAKDPPTPTKEARPRDGILAGVGAAVSELKEKASEAVHGVEEKLEDLAREPASVTAAKKELEEGTSPVAETRAEPPVSSSSATAGELVAANEREVASDGPLPNEPTLDELIDTTLAKESLVAEEKEKEEEREAEKEKSDVLAETKRSEAEIHAADATKGDTKHADTAEGAATPADAAKGATTQPADEPTLDALIDKTMQKEHAEYEKHKAE